MTRQTLANLAAAATTGAALRIARLGSQAITGDEWHSLRAASESGVLELLTTLKPGAHYSAPEAVFFHFLARLFEVSELAIYAPYVIAGIATIVLIPLSLAGRVPAALTILPWAIALSPTLLFYSRYARPYGPMALLAILAVTSFARWEEDKKFSRLVLYACLASLAAWFQIVALPFVFAPLVAHVARALRGRDDALRAIRLVLGCVTPAALLVGVPLLRSPEAVTEKLGGAELTLSSVLDGLALTIGSPESLVAALVLILCSWGFVVLRRRDESSPLLFHFTLASALQIATILLLQPVAGHGPHIFARYAIPITVFALILASAGLDQLTSFLRTTGLKAISVALVLGALFASTILGPIMVTHSQVNLSILGYLIYGSNWKDVLTDGLSARRQNVYASLAALPAGSLTILEVPYKAEDYYLPTRPLIHRQRAVYGVTDGLCSTAADGTLGLLGALDMLRLERTIAVRSFASLDHHGLDLAIFHRDISSETNYPPQFGAYDLDQCVDMFQRELGPPAYDDGRLVVFAMSEAGAQALIAVVPDTRQ